MGELFFKRLKEVLPEVPGIQGKDNYFNSAVLILLLELEGEYHIIFEKRATNISQGGEICLPGGKFDPAVDDNYLDTACRETKEELGILRKNIKVIGQLDTLIANMEVTVDAFVALLEGINLDELKLNNLEVDKVFTVPLSYFENNSPDKYQLRLEVQPSYINSAGEEKVLFPAKELGLPKRYHQPWGGRLQTVYLYQYQQEVIWGITAELIYDLINRLDIELNPSLE